MGKESIDQLADDATLAEARAWLRARVREGEECPCCKRLAKVYKRKLNSGMAYLLVILFRLRGFQPTHINDFIGEQKLSASMVGGVLLHQWGLLDDVPEEGPQEKYKSGIYRVTSLGAQFVKGQVRVRKYICLYNNQRIRSYEEDVLETVSIQEALGDKFDYQELLAA